VPSNSAYCAASYVSSVVVAGLCTSAAAMYSIQKSTPVVVCWLPHDRSYALRDGAVMEIAAICRPLLLLSIVVSAHNDSLRSVIVFRMVVSHRGPLVFRTPASTLLLSPVIPVLFLVGVGVDHRLNGRRHLFFVIRSYLTAGPISSLGLPRRHSCGSGGEDAFGLITPVVLSPHCRVARHNAS
jgi:hypothetical protein